MEKHVKSLCTFYLDLEAQQMEERGVEYAALHEPTVLGEPMQVGQTLFAFILAAYNTERLWGFTGAGYCALQKSFGRTVASIDFGGPQHLPRLVELGYLRTVEVEGEAVYFLTQAALQQATR